jgi:hypothetical protein
MSKPTIQQLAKELVECRVKMKELEDAYKESKLPYEQAKETIQEKILEAMRKEERLSERYEDFTIVRKKSVKAVVLNEFTALGQLKETKPNYVIETIHPNALKEVEKGTLQLEGVQREEKEYISITQKKEEPKAPMSIGTET